MKVFCASRTLLGFVLLLAGCEASRPSSPSPIGLVPLLNYSATTAAPDTAYRVVRTDHELNALMTPAAGVVRPDFGGQVAVAIVLPEAAGQGLKFLRAEYVGTRVHVYAETCASGDAGCTANRLVAATVPKVGSARTVAFFVNGTVRNEVKL